MTSSPIPAKRELQEIIARLSTEAPERDTSEKEQKSSFDKIALVRAYKHAGIPEVFAELDPATLETKTRARLLWDIALPIIDSWQGGQTSKRGLLISGGEGQGKSTALWLNARAAVRSWLVETNWNGVANPANVPIYARRFKHWKRFEFCPTPDGKRSWNYDLVHQMLDARAIFLDDMTFDTAHEAFQPLKEILELLIDELSCMSKPPSLWVTTNNTSDDWAAILGHQLVDRIGGETHGLCQIIKCEWSSFR